MAVTTQPITVEEFERLAVEPENADRRLEFVGGEISEVVSNSYSSLVAARINGFLFVYLLHNPIGYLTGSGSYQIRRRSSPTLPRSASRAVAQTTSSRPTGD